MAEYAQDKFGHAERVVDTILNSTLETIRNSSVLQTQFGQLVANYWTNWTALTCDMGV